MKNIILPLFALFLVCSCGKEHVSKKINQAMYPKEQQEVTATLTRIFDLARTKQLDSIEDYHLYGPKFTKFNDGGSASRQDAELCKKSERELFKALSEFDYSIENLKVDVFDDMAIATFFINVAFKVNGSSGTAKSRGTVVLVKAGKKWKITHEHFSSLAGK